MKKRIISYLLILLSFVTLFSGCKKTENKTVINTSEYIASVNDVPEFDNEPYVIIKDNQPDFKETQLVTYSYEMYSELDYLGRCGYAMACIGKEIMPTEERGSIGQVKPTGWHTIKYDSVDGKYLYNRCHLIGYQLTGENANERNLITGTRYLNMEAMLPFENMIADYVKETGNHVLYRVTPIFDSNNLLARGVQMEAKSVEDDGEGVCFNIYAYNNQPGILINYVNGDSKIDDGNGFTNQEKAENHSQNIKTYVLNTSSKKFHLPECSSVSKMNEQNKETVNRSREDITEDGYTPCQQCKP
ncbi:MAG: DNA/RNA non-specific endonuclease [Clostridia bacterium]|nr:DNA/RNA non-specific endonuclease [Clostridia bacterium]